MSIRSKLFATVALPVFAASVAVQPVFADSLMAPFEVAQEGGEELSPEELLLLKQREEEQRRKAEEKQQRAAEEEQRQAEEEQQRAAEEEQRRQAEEKQQRAAEEQQRQAEEEQQRAAEEQKRQAEEEQQRAAEEEQRKAEEEQQRAAEEEQRQAEEEQQRAAEEEQRKAEEEQQRAAEEEQRQAEEEQQRAAEEEQRQAEEEQQRAAEEEQRQAEEEQPRAAEEEQQRPAEEEQQRAAEEEQRQAEEEQQRAAEEEQQRQAEEEQPRAAEEEQQRQAEEEQQRAAEEKQRQAEEEETAEEPSAATEDETTAEQPAAEEPAEQTGEAEQQPVPEGEEPATAEQMQAEQPEGQPAPEVVDERTIEEKQKIAEDPGATDETILLPVEGGAAVLDSDKDGDNMGGNRVREIRRQQRGEVRAQEEAVEPPTDDAAAQSEIPAEFTEGLPQKMEAALSEEGERVEEAPDFVVPETTNIINNTVVNNTVINNTTNNVTEVRIVEETENRVILEAGDRIFVRGDDRPRLRLHAEETFYEELPRGRYRETIVRPDGYRVVTIYNRYGDILQRTRIDRNGDEYVLIYAPEYEERRRPAIVDVGYELPPMRLTIPVDDYIVDYAEHPDRDYYEFLSEPPVERVERVYTMDEVRHSARLRDKVRRIDLDTITFATGSAEVSMSQAKTLRKVADAMAKILDQDPGETFFIEGHTDAVGSDRSNLLLSDRRADSVATLLSEVYGIPPENLVTQGYGERFLKIRTQEGEQENRRVTIRRVTPLVRPVAQR